MRVRRNTRVVVQTEEYNQWHHEIMVEFTHHDFGFTDETLADLDEDAWEELFSTVKKRATDEVLTDVESFLRRVEKISKVDNIATRHLKQTSSPDNKRLIRRRS